MTYYTQTYAYMWLYMYVHLCVLCHVIKNRVLCHTNFNEKKKERKVDSQLKSEKVMTFIKGYDHYELKWAKKQDHRNMALTEL